ncbi:MAG TPA: c-type cytochrome [Pseudolabrys sp.]|nr:c-type cytochrome [Pseudolabrys sp.]
MTKLVVMSAALVTLAIASAGPGRAEDASSVSPSDVQAKVKYCEVCHGAQVRGFVGYYPIPRLAGQQVEYIENQLKGFIERKRANTASPTTTNIMFGVGHVLTPEMVKALATNFHNLNPPPVGGAPKQNVDAGKKIFDAGVEGTDVPPCSSCHGERGEGNGEIPRLAGQLYPYVVKQLTNWSKERAEKNADVMAPIAHDLTASQIEAVAAYVSYLK